MDEVCAARDANAPNRLRECLRRLEPDAILETYKSRQAHHKFVYCSACDRVFCMRIGAVGCYTGHIGLVTISDATREVLHAKRPHVEDYCAC